MAETAIRAAVEAKDDPADLINAALDEVVRAGSRAEITRLNRGYAVRSIDATTHSEHGL